MDSKKRCITIDETSVMDDSKSHGGVRRCRETEVIISDSGKRRKFYFRDQENSGTCDHVSSSPLFNSGLRLDLKAELRFETKTSMSGDDGFSRETSPSSEICLNSDKTESFSIMKKKPAPPRAVTFDREPPPPATAGKTPTAEEIEEFFSVDEKKEQKRFADKYNFDIVNDVAMDGRYEWVRLKP